VFINLIRNAIEAMNTVRDGRRVQKVTAEPHDNEAIIISVRDTGPGVDPQLLDRIFDLFVTTKSTRDGIGTSPLPHDY
jgi:signal transduction histidine kinase